jgi:hypothetical protein
MSISGFPWNASGPRGQRSAVSAQRGAYMNMFDVLNLK